MMVRMGIDHEDLSYLITIVEKVPDPGWAVDQEQLARVTAVLYEAWETVQLRVPS